jgi:hypothetical protein
MRAMSLVARMITALAFVSVVAPRAAGASPLEFTVQPALPTGWMTTGEMPVVISAAGAVDVTMLGAYVDTRVVPQYQCVLERTGCAPFASFLYTIRPASLADGRHELVLVGMNTNSETSVRRIPFRVDHTPPSAPSGLQVDGDEGWRAENRFRVSWGSRAGLDAGAPVTAVRYDICPVDARTSCLSGRRAGDLTALDDLQVPDTGAWRLRVAEEDEAGNVDIEAGATATLRLDDDPPELAFAAREPSNPARVALRVVDTESGVADVAIEARRHGDTRWYALPVDRGRTVTAVLDDDLLAAGTYEIRGWAIDAMGNERTIAGSDIALPIRQESRIVAGVATGKSLTKAPKLDAHPLLAFGVSPVLRGSLTDSNRRPRSSAPITVSERVGPSDGWRVVATLVTSHAGEFKYRAPKGPSRQIRLEYRGTSTSRAAAVEVALRVRAKTTLTASRRRLRNGESLRLRGAVQGAPIPRAGKLITLQARVPGGWRTFGNARARAKDGRWSYRYTFTRTPTTARYTFRAVVPREEAFPYATGVSARLSVVVVGSH